MVSPNIKEATNELLEKQKEDNRNDVEADEVITSNDVNGVIDKTSLMGFDEACNENVNNKKIECTGLTALADICKENVKGLDMELDDNNKCLVVVDSIVVKIGSYDFTIPESKNDPDLT
ncbi:hypothetical protein Tco_0074909 [Tanacetum coccineum]